MENIRTRNDATPAPKLPLTWDETTQDTGASEQSTQEQPPVQEQSVQAPPAQEQSVQAPPLQESPVQAPPLQESPVQAPPAQQASSVQEPPLSSAPTVSVQTAPPVAAQEQVRESLPIQAPPMQEQSVKLPLVQALSAQQQEQPPVQAPPVQEPPLPPVSVLPAPPVAAQEQVQEPLHAPPAPVASVQMAPPVAAQEQVQESPQAQEILTLKTPDEPTSVILKRARSERGVSISDVCKKVFITRTFIVDLENGNFRDLPPKEQCLAQIERLCREYDIPAVDIVDKFDKEYTVYSDEKKNSEKTSNSQLSEAKHPGYGFSPRSRQINLPSILIILFVLFLVALFGYAFYAYNSRKLPPQLNIDLSEHVPIHKPKAVYLDEIRVRK